VSKFPSVGQVEKVRALPPDPLPPPPRKIRADDATLSRRRDGAGPLRHTGFRLPLDEAGGGEGGGAGEDDPRCPESEDKARRAEEGDGEEEEEEAARLERGNLT